MAGISDKPVETFSIGYFGIWGNGGYIDASDYALIMGAGPVGLSAAMVAKTSGAKVVVADVNAVRRERALKFGADVVLNPMDPDYYDQIKKQPTATVLPLSLRRPAATLHWLRSLTLQVTAAA